VNDKFDDVELLFIEAMKGTLRIYMKDFNDIRYCGTS
jgi:hypothetical protein